MDHELINTLIGPCSACVKFQPKEIFKTFLCTAPYAVEPLA